MVYGAVGIHGQFVQQNVEEDSHTEKESATAQRQLSEVNHVLETERNQNHVKSNHVLLTEHGLHGQDGALATNHVEVD